MMRMLLTWRECQATHTFLVPFKGALRVFLGVCGAI